MYRRSEHRDHAQAHDRLAQLGEFLRRFAALHCEGGDDKKLLLREYANAETGVGWGCADYMHSTFNDLLIRHARMAERDDSRLA